MPHSTSVRVVGGRRGVEFGHLQKESRLFPSAVNSSYDLAVLKVPKPVFSYVVD